MTQTPYQWLYRVARSLHDDADDRQHLLQNALRLTGGALDARQGCLLTFTSGGDLEQVVVLGAATPGAESTWAALVNQGVIGFARHSQRIIPLRDLRTDPRWPSLPDDAVLPQTGSAVAVPLLAPTGPTGVLLLFHPDTDYFDSDRLALLDEITSLIARVLARAQTQPLLLPSAQQTGQLRAAFESATEPTLITDGAGRISEGNARARRLFGYPGHRLRLLPITTFLRIDAETIEAETLSASNDEVTFTTTAWTTVNPALTVEVRVRRVEVGGEPCLLWYIHDVARDAHLNKLRRDLAAMTYHDLRGPLSNISGSLGRMSSLLNGSQTPAIETLMQIARRSTGQMQRMIDTLLDINRLEDDDALANRQRTAMNTLLADAVESLRPQVQAAEQRLHFRIENDLPQLDVDPDMITRVIANLVDNACKYSPDGGEITLSAGLTPDGLCISVRDTGPGIPPEVRSSIFDKYVRLHHKSVRGIGLGLAFCRLAVEAHGGTIWVESEVGHGSMFCFTLPLETTAEAVTE